MIEVLYVHVNAQLLQAIIRYDMYNACHSYRKRVL